MDSSESGSMQSTSGEDEHESESSTAAAVLKQSDCNKVSSLFRNVVPMAEPSQPLKVNYLHHLHPSSSCTSAPYSHDPLSSCYKYPSSSAKPIGQNTSSTHPPLFNVENIWSKKQRSDPSCNDLGAAAVGELQQFLSPNLTQVLSSSTTTVNHNTLQETSSTGRNSCYSSNNMMGIRNPKKRSRASRRAPTTVLTTDTNNFRAMVQEFTGIPVAPFTSSSASRVGRLDIYGNASSSRSALEGSPLLTANSLPPYLLRPFPHKIQQPPSILSQLAHVSPPLGVSTSHVDATTITTQMGGSAIPHSSTSSSIDLLANINQQQNLLTHFQSLANASLTLPSPSNIDTSSNLKMDALEEFGLTHGHAGSGLMQLQSSGLMQLQASSSPLTMGLARNSLYNRSGDQFIRSVSGNYNNSQSAVTSSGNDLSGFVFH